MDYAAECFVPQTAMSMTALATETHKDEAGRITVFAVAGEAACPNTALAQSGIAFLGSFYGGHLHLLRARVRLQRAARLRIEIHGFASRMNKLVAEIAGDGTIVTCGEEIEAIEISAIGEELAVMLRFRAERSLVEWIYLLAQEVGAGSQALFSCGDICLQAQPESGSLLNKRHCAAKRYKGIDVICQSLTVLRSSFNLTFEILKPGSRLVGLRLSSELELAYARWWSSEAAAIVPLAGELQAVLPRFPIRSPALMDRYGPHCANLGHTISGIFADWQDIDRLDGPASDRLVALVLHARFSCGEVVDLPLVEIMGPTGDLDHGTKLFRKYLAHYQQEGPAKPRFLEVGARGPASRIMRGQVKAKWDYIGLDYKADGNVDIIGDAHRLSEILESASIDLVYSAEC